MKLVNFYRRPISVFVMVTFSILLCFWTNQSPAAPADHAPEKKSAASLEKGESEGTNFIEQEGSSSVARKGKHFPWLIVGVAVIIGAAAVYFLVINKKYTLTTTVGEGVAGTPATGASTYKKGTGVNYSYAMQNGYGDLKVTLDGNAVAASGTVTMNANHTLAASATQTFNLTVIRGEHVEGTPAPGIYPFGRGASVHYNYSPTAGYAHLQVKLDNALVSNSGDVTMNEHHTLTALLEGANIEVNSTPTGARIFIDNADSGFTTPHAFFFPGAVTKTILLRSSCGYKEFSQTVSASMGQTAVINATLAAGIKEDFNIPASSCWLPLHSGSWSTSGGYYKSQSNTSDYETSTYLSNFQGNYTVIVKMNRKSGPASYWPNGIFLGISNAMSSASGYLFQFYDDLWGIWLVKHYDLTSGSLGYTDAIHWWSSSTAINKGFNKWNILKITKAGSTYKFYINNTLLCSFTDSYYDPYRCTLMYYCMGATSEILYDYIYLNP